MRSSSVDLSAKGAGWMAGLAVGFWSSLDELAALPIEVECFTPSMSGSRREELLDGWSEALHRAASSYGDFLFKERSHGSNR
jgi:glycerol kinase